MEEIKNEIEIVEEPETAETVEEPEEIVEKQPILVKAAYAASRGLAAIGNKAKKALPFAAAGAIGLAAGGAAKAWLDSKKKVIDVEPEPETEYEPVEGEDDFDPPFEENVED